MMKHLKRIGSLLAAACCLLSLAGMTVSAERAYDDIKENCRVYDEGGYFTAEELEELDALVAETADYIDMYFAIQIVDATFKFGGDSDAAIEYYTDIFYNDLFNPVDGVDTDGLVLLLNNKTNYDYVSTSGRGELYFTNADSDDRVTEMLEDITPSLKRQDYYGAIELFCGYVKDNYDAGVPSSHYYTYNDDTGLYMYMDNGELVYSDSRPIDWSFLIISSFLTSLVISVIVGFCIKRAYRFKSSPTPTAYICQNDTKFRAQTDTFIRQYTTKTKIETSSGGGGGGHSHSSGGHSHGGGGHHR